MKNTKAKAVSGNILKIYCNPQRVWDSKNRLFLETARLPHLHLPHDFYNI